jgi:hypothetical protein
MKIDKILSDKHQEIGLMNISDTIKCDHAITVLGLDKHRDRYFARTRQGDTTGIQNEFLEIDYYYLFI